MVQNQTQRNSLLTYKRQRCNDSEGYGNPEYFQHTEIKSTFKTMSVFQLADSVEEEPNFSRTAQVKNLAPKPFRKLVKVKNSDFNRL